MGIELIILDSHPVQYKAPVYRELERLRPGRFKVVYVSDWSMRGGRIDKGFNREVAWDTPLLEGYSHIVLNNERAGAVTGPWSLHGRGIFALLKREAPRAVLISQFYYLADWVAYLSCLRLGIPIWIRHETQDEAAVRSGWKAFARSAYYFCVYRNVRQAFYIGELNRRHLLRHGVQPEKLHFSPYCVESPFGSMSLAEKQEARNGCRRKLNVAEDETLVLFAGKLIEKKNPGLVLEALALLESEKRGRFRVVYVGSGDLEPELRKRAERFGPRVQFAGFVNQSQLPPFYLAADILVLPSKRRGETWGLVVNEALHAGCAAVVSDAVGCKEEFGSWERVRVIPDGDAQACATALAELAAFPRDFDWCRDRMAKYSVHAAAAGLAALV